MNQNIQDKVFEIISQVFDINPEKITLETKSTVSSNWDSLNIINLMVALESEFGVMLDPDDVADMTNVKAILASVEKSGIE